MQVHLERQDLLGLAVTMEPLVPQVQQDSKVLLASEALVEPPAPQEPMVLLELPETLDEPVTPALRERPVARVPPALRAHRARLELPASKDLLEPVEMQVRLAASVSREPSVRLDPRVTRVMLDLLELVAVLAQRDQPVHKDPSEQLELKASEAMSELAVPTEQRVLQEPPALRARQELKAIVATRDRAA